MGAEQGWSLILIGLAGCLLDCVFIVLIYYQMVLQHASKEQIGV